MALAHSSTHAKRSSLSKSASMDGEEEGIETLGENNGLGKILLGMRYQTSCSCLEVRIVRAQGLRCFTRSAASNQTKPSTFCRVSFMPDGTEPVSTATEEGSDCPRWRGAFRFEKFPWTESSANQRCLLVQVCNAVSGTVISELTILLGSWNLEEYARGVRVWKYLNGSQETQRASEKGGNAFMTLYNRGDRLKLTLHRVEDLNSRWTAASEPPEFYAKLQAVVLGRVVKAATLKGLRSPSAGGEANFFDGEFNVRLGKHGAGCLTLRLVLTRALGSTEQELYWLDLGAEAKRMDCRTLYQSLLEMPNQSHMVSVRLSRAPVPPLLSQQSKREA